MASSVSPDGVSVVNGPPATSADTRARQRFDSCFGDQTATRTSPHGVPSSPTAGHGYSLVAGNRSPDNRAFTNRRAGPLSCSANRDPLPIKSSSRSSDT